MIYKEYGKTGKKVSAIGFGGMRFLSDEYNKDIGIAAELVIRASEMGITYFDTAPGYCDDKSELIFGEAFKNMNGKEINVSTKCGLWNAKDADGARRMVEKSLKRLNVPKITFYNLWCIKTLDEYEIMTKKGGIYDGILRAKEEGLIEHICCSSHTNGDDIAKIASDGLVEGVTLGYNAVNFAYRRKGVVACHKAGLGTITMNPLGGGLIPNHDDYFSFLTNGTNDSVAVSALKFLLAQDEVTVTLPGISSIKELEDAVLACENLPKVDEAYLEKFAKRLGEELNSLCTGCGYCDSCPVDIPIPKLLDSYNENIINGGGKFALDRLDNHWGITNQKAKECIECGQCEKLCTQKLPIIKRLKELADF